MNYIDIIFIVGVLTMFIGLIIASFAWWFGGAILIGGFLLISVALILGEFEITY